MNFHIFTINTTNYLQSKQLVKSSIFQDIDFRPLLRLMAPLQLTVTWYAGEQATHWGIQNKPTSSSQN